MTGLKSLEMNQLEPLSNYEGQFSTHALFYKPKTQAVTEAPAAFDELLRPYLLTGIIQGAEPEALIRNNITKQTYFVQAGEQFDQFKMVEIKQHSAVVEYQGNQRELRLEEGGR